MIKIGIAVYRYADEMTDVIFKRFLRKFVNFLIPVAAHLSWIIVAIQHHSSKKFFFSKNRKRILLIAQNKIAADHIKIIWDLLKNDPQLAFFTTDDRLIDKHFSRKELLSIMPVNHIHILHALLRNWDMIIYVNHPWGLGIWFAPFIKKIYINHGICMGKINNPFGEDGVYGKSRVLRPYSKPIYDKMFAASFFEKDYAIAATEELRSRIAVTGFLKADLIDNMQADQRDAIRTKLGYGKDDILVHIISTWGPMSLFQTIGEELLFEATKISDKYKFIFSLHPRHDEFGDIKGRNREDILNKYETQGIRPDRNMSWEDYVVSCDVAVSDHSSLCFYYVLLNKPLILTSIKDNSYIKNSVFDYLKQLTPTLNHPEQLSELLKFAIMNTNQTKLREFGLMIRDYPGHAAERYKEEIYKILDN